MKFLLSSGAAAALLFVAGAPASSSIRGVGAAIVAAPLSRHSTSRKVRWPGIGRGRPVLNLSSMTAPAGSLHARTEIEPTCRQRISSARAVIDNSMSGGAATSDGGADAGAGTLCGPPPVSKSVRKVAIIGSGNRLPPVRFRRMD